MNMATNSSRTLRLFVLVFAVLCLALLTPRAWALDNENPNQFSREELAQMLAPIALYPDSLLSQILMASTYPIEVVEADRWVSDHPLTGNALDAALLDQDWDPSVKALCHFPSILAMMSERIGETTDLGNAFLDQEAEVMDMVQELRATAYEQGHLNTNAQQQVVVENGTYIIQPANTQYVYVPYYDPYFVYGSWWYPAYPPYYWGPAGAEYWAGVSYWPGVYFSFSFGTWSYFDWHRHYIHIDVHKRPRFVRHDRWIVRTNHWAHAPSHRRGVVYHNRATAVKYGQPARHSTSYRRSHSVGQRRPANRHQPNRERIRLSTGRQNRQTVTPARQVREHRNPFVQQQVNNNKPGRLNSDRARVARSHPRQARGKLATGRQNRPTVAPDRRVRERSNPVVQQRAATESLRQVQQTEKRDRQVMKRVDRGQRQPATLGRGRPARQQVAPARQMNVRSDRNRQQKIEIKQDHQRQELAERGTAKRRFSKVPNRGKAGNRLRSTAERGRSDRYERKGASRGKNRSGDRGPDDQDG